MHNDKFVADLDAPLKSSVENGAFSFYSHTDSGDNSISIPVSTSTRYDVTSATQHIGLSLFSWREVHEDEDLPLVVSLAMFLYL